MMPIEQIVNQIHHGKWEEVMPQVPDSCVDLIITSPPYNVSLGIGNKLRIDGYDSYDDNMPYTDYLAWMDKLYTECHRVLKTGGRICVNIGDGANGSVCTHADFTVRMRDMHKFIPITTIVWNKSQIGSHTSWGSWKSPSQPSFPTPFEFIIVMAKETKQHTGDPNKITVSKEDFMRNSNALWVFPPDTQMMKKWDHPATFPEELPRRLIHQLSYEDDVVLDPFSGSGTVASVAKRLKRKYIGIEMSEKYVKISRDRVANTNGLFD